MNLGLYDQYHHNHDQHIRQADQHRLANIARTQRRSSHGRSNWRTLLSLGLKRPVLTIRLLRLEAQ